MKKKIIDQRAIIEDRLKQLENNPHAGALKSALLAKLADMNGAPFEKLPIDDRDEDSGKRKATASGIKIYVSKTNNAQKATYNTLNAKENPTTSITSRYSNKHVAYPEHLTRVMEKYNEINRKERIKKVGFEIKETRGKKRYIFKKLGIAISFEPISFADWRRIDDVTKTRGGHLPREINPKDSAYDANGLYPKDSEFDEIIITIPVDDIQLKGVIFGQLLALNTHPCYTGRSIGEGPRNTVVRTFYTKRRERTFGDYQSRFHTRAIKFI